jgi:hypothetical protein
MRPVSGAEFSQLLYNHSIYQPTGGSHKFWNGKTSKLFRSISRGRDKPPAAGVGKDMVTTGTGVCAYAHPSNVSVVASASAHELHNSRSQPTVAAQRPAIANSMTFSQKHGTITASGLHALQGYSYDAMPQ